MTVHVIGAKGRLGKALVEAHGTGIAAPPRDVYSDWASTGGADRVEAYLRATRPVGGSGQDTVLVASGLLDPALPEAMLRAVNHDLPANIIAGAARTGARVVTFGTVMETIAPDANAYVRSKADLAVRVRAAQANGESVLHLRIHTLYGSAAPSPFMFLGQILAAILADRPFAMTSGRQLREYHHIDDEAGAIRLLAASGATGLHDLSHGRPLALKTIAETVFAGLDRSHLLRVGALPEPLADNFERRFPASAIARQVGYRDTLPAIVDSLARHVPQRGAVR